MTLRDFTTELARERLARRLAVLAEDAQPPQHPNQAQAGMVVMRAARLQAVANWIAGEVGQYTRSLQAKLVAQVREHQPVTDASLHTLFAGFARDVGTIFEQAARQVEDWLDEAAAAMTEHGREAAARHLGAAGGTRRPVSGAGVLVMGATIPEHFDKMASDCLFRAKAAVRQGLAAGDDSAGMERRITGDAKVTASEPVRAAAPPAAVGLITGLKEASDSSIFKVVQQALTAVAQAVDEDIGESEDDDGRGWTWVSAQDGRVCEECQFYDGGQWDQDLEPVGDSPELDVKPGQVHYGCRCALVPCDLNAPPQEGGLDDYLGQFTDEEQREAFGPAIDAYRRGDISASALMGQRDHAMSLERFRDGEPELKFDAGKYAAFGRRAAEAANERTAERRAARASLGSSHGDFVRAAAGDLPVSQKAIMTDADGRVLILKSAGDEYWDLPGGHLREGEDLEAGLRREVREETGLELDRPSPRILPQVLNLGGHDALVVFWDCPRWTGSPVLSAEHTDWRLVPRCELGQYNLGAFAPALGMAGSEVPA